jgi:hypothetical protein
MGIAMETGDLVCLSFQRQGWINIDDIFEPVWSAEELILPTDMVDFHVDFSYSDSDKKEAVISHSSEESLSICAEESDSE